jgi:hypothetical protein
MDEKNDDINANFFQLVVSLQFAAMQQMGKIASPISGKIERNLEQARSGIDMLGMLAEKTKGNLTPKENNFLSNVLYELRMNFLDEQKKAGQQETPEKSESDGKKENENKT